MRISTHGVSGYSSSNSSNAGARLEFGQYDDGYDWVTGSIDSPRTGGNWGGDLVFSTNNDSASTNQTERMRIKTDGPVIIQGDGLTTNLRLHGRSTDNNFYTLYKSNDGATTYASFGTSSSAGEFLYQSDIHKFQNLSSANTYATISSSGIDFTPTAGGSFNFKGNGGNQLSIKTSQYTGGSGTSISTSNVQVVNSAFGALVFVAGYGSGQFCDLVYFGYNASPTIIAQQTIAGSPPSRIYTGSGYALYLRYSSGTLTTKVNWIESHS